MLSRPLISTLFPYTTLFRSIHGAASRARKRGVGGEITLAGFPLVPWATCRNPSAGSTAIPYEILTSPLRSEEHTSELESRGHLVCRLLLEKKNKNNNSAKLT